VARWSGVRPAPGGPAPGAGIGPARRGCPALLARLHFAFNEFGARNDVPAAADGGGRRSVASPRVPDDRAGQAENLLNCGLARLAEGAAAGAADLCRAAGLFAAEPSLTGPSGYLFACARAAMSGPAGRPGSGMGVSSIGRFERRSSDGFEPRRRLYPSHWGG
jgi:hypothetical protein